MTRISIADVFSYPHLLCHVTASFFWYNQVQLANDYLTVRYLRLRSANPSKEYEYPTLPFYGLPKVSLAHKYPSTTRIFQVPYGPLSFIIGLV